MVYERQNFTDGAVLAAAQLNHIEEFLETLDGENIGYSPKIIVKTEKTTTGTRVTIVTTKMQDGAETSDATSFVVADGTDGTSITEVEVTVLEAGSEPTAEVSPISPVTPLARRLKLGIPATPAPVRGEDYWTEDDKAEIKSYVDEAILGGEW